MSMSPPTSPRVHPRFGVRFFSALCCLGLALLVLNADAQAQDRSTADRAEGSEAVYEAARARYDADRSSANHAALQRAAAAYKAFVRANDRDESHAREASNVGRADAPQLVDPVFGILSAHTNYPSADVPKPVPPVGTSGTTTSTLNVAPSGIITDIDVNIDITHTFVGDLEISLTSPAGTTVLMSDNNDGSGDDYSGTTFDDEAAFPIGFGTPPFTGSFIPDNPLSAFDGEDVQGIWTLTVDDVLTGDVGTLNSWSIDVLTDTDTDGDGVADDADVCPGTVIPEATVPSNRLLVNRFALTDGDTNFDTVAPNGPGPGRSYDTEDTGGCSCEQIIDALGLGGGHARFGCSISAMDEWIASLNGAAKQGDGVSRLAGIPDRFALSGNYPNPFNPATRISFDLPETSAVRLTVFDLMGRVVEVLADGTLEAGSHEVMFKAANLPSGTYLYRLETPAGSFTQKMQLLK